MPRPAPILAAAAAAVALGAAMETDDPGAQDAPVGMGLYPVDQAGEAAAARNYHGYGTNTNAIPATALGEAIDGDSSSIGDSSSSSSSMAPSPYAGFYAGSAAVGSASAEERQAMRALVAEHEANPSPNSQQGWLDLAGVPHLFSNVRFGLYGVDSPMRPSFSSGAF